MGGQRKSKINPGKQTKLSANIRKKNYILCDSWEAQIKPTAYNKSIFCYLEIHFPTLKCSAHPFCFILVFVSSLHCGPTK